MITPVKLTTAQHDRAAGVLLATAAGDALGAGYEFGPPLDYSTTIRMAGGGTFGWAPGEWTDDTSMAIVIAQAAADGSDLRDEATQDRIARGWVEWARTARDVGTQTRAVFGSAQRAAGDGPVTAALLREAARAHHERTGRSGGNGSLMRTAPVALAFLGDEDGLIEAATTISALTHYDPEAGEACVLWCLAIRHQVLTGEPGLYRGLDQLPADRAAIWTERLEEAESKPASAFTNNGWVVQALQGAWSALFRTPGSEDEPTRREYGADSLRRSLQSAVRGGGDTDTVAAIGGGMLGALYGASAVPAEWRRILHGWPGMDARGLVALARSVATGGAAPFDGDYSSWGDLSPLARHPHDDGVLIGAVGNLHSLPDGVDAVVSLCRIAPHDVPDGVEVVEVRLIDDADPEQNPNLHFVLDDTVNLIEDLRREGRTVLLHCVQAQSRTPTIAALYGSRLRKISAAEALADVVNVLPAARPNAGFLAAMAEIDAPTTQWGQWQCAPCEAWLKPMFDRADRLPDDAAGLALWRYTWVCVSCGTERFEVEAVPPYKYIDGATLDHHAPGTRPSGPDRDPNSWDPAPSAESYFIADPGAARAEAEANGALAVAEKDLVRHCWALSDSLEGRGLIHEFGHLSGIRDALAAQDIAALVAAAVVYADLMQHEAEHSRELSSYHGAEADTTAIVADLALIPLAQQIRMGR